MKNIQLQLIYANKLEISRKDAIFAEEAKDLSNETIDKVFKPTCLPTKLIGICKKLRDCGLITINDL